MALEPHEIRNLAETHAANDDPTGWFEHVYKNSGGDINQVVWADLVANPCLVDWLKKNTLSEKRAIVVGCGLGDDVAYLTKQGFAAMGFDVSATAVDMCQKRYTEISESFQVANLFGYPTEWLRSFDLVFECNTVQALKGKWRAKALNAIAELVAPGGTLLVSCRSRNAGERGDEFPLPLDHAEIAGFERAGLKKMSLEEYVDKQAPPFPHFFACYRRP